MVIFDENYKDLVIPSGLSFDEASIREDAYQKGYNAGYEAGNTQGIETGKEEQAQIVKNKL